MNQRTPISCRRRWSRGFTLLEGLLAMVVMAVGMLALVTLQSTLRYVSDDAKLRTEATRLAQQKLDELRGFEQVAIDPLDLTKVTYNGTVISSPGPESINPASYSNTTFTRTWNVAANSDVQKSVTVTVAWVDRRGNQQLSLSTVIGRADPSAISTLGVGPGSTVVRRPKNRNINIPYPAISLDGNKSAFKPVGSNTVIYFDNGTGDVVGRCTGQEMPDEGDAANLDGCDIDVGYLLSGYVRFCTTNNCSTTNQPGDAGATYANASDTTRALDATAPLLLDSSNKADEPSDSYCFSSRQVTLNDGSTVADTGQANNQIAARFISYACVVYPGATNRWWGRVTIAPDGSWAIGTSAGQYKVCRFSGDYDLDGVASNAEHPLWYRAVTAALGNQNYLVIPQANACPTDKPTDAVNGDFVSANTVTHQTVGTTLSGALPSFTCATIACNGAAKTVFESATLDAIIGMY